MLHNLGPKGHDNEPGVFLENRWFHTVTFAFFDHPVGAPSPDLNGPGPVERLRHERVAQHRLVGARERLGLR
jgi:hypothetical protein